MKVRLSLFAVALVVVVNIYVLAGVAWNRSGQAEAVLELTERELAMPYVHDFQGENSGIALRIQRPQQEFDWLDDDKLRELGIDPEGFAQRSHDRWRSEVRKVYAVLEFDGPAFGELVAEQEERVEAAREGLEKGETSRRQVETAEAALERLETAESRLVVVDAGKDPDSLRKRYTERENYAVMQALVRIHATSLPGQEPEWIVRARIGSLLPRRVHVPRRHHAPLRRATEERRNAHDAPPRYRVVVKFGRRAEPWVADIEPMPGRVDSDTSAD